MEQIWIIKADGTETFVYPSDMQEGDREATQEEVEIIVNGPKPTLEEACVTKLIEINTKYSEAMQYIQAGYPTEEILSWERQASQARELLVNPDAKAVFVRGLASQKGVPVPEMRDRILANAANWEPIAALLTAQRQIMEERTYMATTIEEIEAIKVGYSV